MQEINVWELSNFDKQYTVLTDINAVVKEILEGNLKIDEDSIRTRFVPGEKICDNLQRQCSEDNTIINYTDSNHPVLLSPFFLDIIDPSFYKKYEKEIKEAVTNYIKNYDTSIIAVTVPKFVFTDELFDYLIENHKNVYFPFELEEKYLHKLENRFTNVQMLKESEKVVVSDDIVFGNVRMPEVQRTNFFQISISNLVNSKVEYFKYVKPGSILDLSIDKAYEEKELIALSDFLVKLDSVEGIDIIIKVPIERRSNFNKAFQNVKLNNVKLVIQNDNYSYPLSQYQAEETRLDVLVKPIKEANLSPFEKYLACYNIVKQYKEYNEHPDAKTSETAKNYSRNLRYILDNEYMVCVGFATLLKELLDRVGIVAQNLSVSVDTSYNQGYTQEEKTLQFAGHNRLVLNMNDDKYNIHGLYISDPTWDNDLQHSLLNNALLTFDKMQVSRRLFKFSFEQPVMDIHNFQEFNDQVNLLLKRTIHESMKNAEEAYITNEYSGIMDTKRMVCETLIQEFNPSERDDYLRRLKKVNLPTLMSSFLEDLEKHILELNNHNIHSHEDFIRVKDALYAKYLKVANRQYLKKTYSNILKKSYSEVCQKIIAGLKVDPKYVEYYEKLDKCKNEQDYIDFLTNLGRYLLTRVNIPVSSETIIKASMESDRILKDLSQEEYEQKLQEVTNLYEQLESYSFPYERDDSLLGLVPRSK